MAENKMAGILVKQAYEKGRQDLAREVMERVGCIETCYGDDYDMGVDWAVCEALRIINEMVGGSDGSSSSVVRQEAGRTIHSEI